MGSFRLLKKKQSFKKNKMSIPFNLLVISYLLICIVALLSSPTTASFHDTQTMEGKLTAGNTFEESEGKKDVDDSDSEVEQQAMDGSDQVEDETVDAVEQEQDNPDAKEDQQSIIVDPELTIDENEAK